MILPDGSVADADGRVYLVLENPEALPAVRQRVHRQYCKCKGDLGYHDQQQAVAS